MVHIKKVEIFGFKSFGFKNTPVHFEPGLVSISGANGSGKSNILDAIIFATGEARPSMMRVGKMASLMHDVGGALAEGSPSVPEEARVRTRRARSQLMTRVVLHFDNTDRKIPVASDTVSIARELDAGGENAYYLNGKHSSRSHITDVLDIVHVGQGYLNVVQQGTVAKISEYTPTEIRESIADLVGITAFDNKIEEAYSQLELADRKLEVALAGMFEVKKHIDELEVERNAKMRHDLIRSDLVRYRALHAREQLRNLMSEKVSKEEEISCVTSEIDTLRSDLEGVRSESSQLSKARKEAMDTESAYRDAKEELESKLHRSVEDHDNILRDIKMSESRMSQIDDSLASMAERRSEVSASKKYLDAEVREKEKLLETAESERAEIQGQLARVDSELSDILEEQSAAAARRSELDSKIRSLNKEENDLVYKKLKAAQNRTNLLDSIETYSEKMSRNKSLISELDASVKKMSSIIRNSEATISDLEAEIGSLGGKKSRHESDLEDLTSVLEKSSNAATKYESKIKMVKGFMHEDYSTAKLKEHASSLGIEGLVCDVMAWDKEYERPVLAASSDWIKAMVVNDFETMLGISEAARSQNLPKFKLVPLNAVSNLRLDALPPAIGGIKTLGTLADHVRCDPRYDALRRFLFGSVVLVDDRESAKSVSGQGYRAVSMSGVYFEARGGTVVVDLNSKISEMTRLISMSGDVEGLARSISLIRRYIQKKRASIKELGSVIQSRRRRVDLSKSRIRSAQENSHLVGTRLEILRDAVAKIPHKVSEMRRAVEAADSDIASYMSRIERIQNDIARANAEHASGEQMQISERMSAANSAKASLTKQETDATARCNRITSELSKLRGDVSGQESQDSMLDDQSGGLRREREQHAAKLADLAPKIESARAILEDLRQQEHEMMSTSKSSMKVIQGYDEKIGILEKRDRAMSEDISGLLRRSDALNRDLSSMARREDDLWSVAYSGLAMSASARARRGPGRNDAGTDIGVDAYGHDGTGDDCSDADYEDPLDVGSIVAELESELESLSELNAGAPSRYAEITRGYKTQSERRNELESERNSIVQFIKRVERDRRQTFLDAFEVVDGEVRRVFKKMTGGSAWLELQDEDDIFNSGISYMVQFPDKPHRDSRSISGGEKTLAGVTFVLALQKLQPSPFYLFDEADASLDGPNAERLSNILAERARESQFIMVSHKAFVVEKAELIYGVFPKGGVSHVVRYRDRRLLASDTAR